MKSTLASLMDIRTQKLCHWTAGSFPVALMMESFPCVNENFFHLHFFLKVTPLDLMLGFVGEKLRVLFVISA